MFYQNSIVHTDSGVLRPLGLSFLGLFLHGLKLGYDWSYFGTMNEPVSMMDTCFFRKA